MRTFPRSFLRSVLRFTFLATLAPLLVASAAFSQPSSTWVRLNSILPPPSARLAPMMTYDPISQKTIMFGGYDGSQYLNDTWMLDGQVWARVPTQVAPPARAAGGMAYDSKLQQVILFGGYNGQYFNDTWLWNGTTRTWTPTAPLHQPVPVTLPMMFPDPLSGRVDELGGFDGQFYQLTSWRWKDGSWHKLYPAQSPYARAAAVVGTNPILKQTVLFGGLADLNPDNTWTYDGHSWTEVFPSTQPSQRLTAGTVYDPRFSGIVTFGGFAGVDVNETWLWNGNDWSQLAPQQSPPPRESMGIAFDELQQRTVVFGGLDGNTLLNDTWALETQ